MTLYVAVALVTFLTVTVTVFVSPGDTTSSVRTGEMYMPLPVFCACALTSELPTTKIPTSAMTIDSSLVRIRMNFPLLVFALMVTETALFTMHWRCHFYHIRTTTP